IRIVPRLDRFLPCVLKGPRPPARGPRWFYGHFPDKPGSSVCLAAGVGRTGRLLLGPGQRLAIGSGNLVDAELSTVHVPEQLADQAESEEAGNAALRLADGPPHWVQRSEVDSDPANAPVGSLRDFGPGPQDPSFVQRLSDSEPAE